MRHFIVATCCAMALAPGFALAQFLPQAAPRIYRERPAPPTEPSIPLAPGAVLAQYPPQTAPSPFGERAPPATEPSVTLPPQAVPLAQTPLAKKADERKPVVRQKTARRPGRGPTGPVTLPPSDTLVMMVRGALAGANQANFTENYSVLHQLTTPALQSRLSATKLGTAFSSLRKQNLDLSPTLVLPPQFTVTPAVTPQGALRLAGFFPTRPLQINFDIVYLPVDGIWSIDALSLAAVQAGGPAPTANVATSGAGSESSVGSQPMIVRKMSGTCIQQAKAFCRDVPPAKLREVAMFRPV